MRDGHVMTHHIRHASEPRSCGSQTMTGGNTHRADEFSCVLPVGLAAGE